MHRCARRVAVAVAVAGRALPLAVGGVPYRHRVRPLALSPSLAVSPSPWHPSARAPLAWTKLTASSSSSASSDAGSSSSPSLPRSCSVSRARARASSPLSSLGRKGQYDELPVGVARSELHFTGARAAPFGVFFERNRLKYGGDIARSRDAWLHLGESDKKDYEQQAILRRQEARKEANTRKLARDRESPSEPFLLTESNKMITYLALSRMIIMWPFGMAWVNRQNHAIDWTQRMTYQRAGLDHVIAEKTPTADYCVKHGTAFVPWKEVFDVIVGMLRAGGVNEKISQVYSHLREPHQYLHAHKDKNQSHTVKIIIHISKAASKLLIWNGPESRYRSLEFSPGIDAYVVDGTVLENWHEVPAISDRKVLSLY